MLVSTSKGTRTRNRLLATLAHDEYERLLPHFELVDLTIKELVTVEERPLEYAYFPETCVVSIVARADADAFVEIATVGCEGMIGTALLLGSDTTPHRSFSQIPGQCLRVSADAFRQELTRGGTFVIILQRYMQQLMVQVAQGAACNSRHTAEQRCARWLLMTRDRVDSDHYPLTHDFLCQMLGVRRATVSEIASGFQDAGLIRYNRGKLTILDRNGLERVACECYQVIRDEYNRPLLAPASGVHR